MQNEGDRALRIGEVIEATTAEFKGECYELDCAPPLGSFVKTAEGDVEILGVVSWAGTETLDPGRPPRAIGRDAHSEEEIQRENPHLSQLFRTTFNALVVGHRQDDSWHHYLPPRPGRLHSFVRLCDPNEVQEFTRSFDFLSILVRASGPVSADELVAACLRCAAKSHDDNRKFLVSAGKELAVLLGGELNRLNTILKRIAHA